MKAKCICITVLIIISCGTANAIDRCQSNKETKSHFEWVMDEVRNCNSKNILVVAHRGDWRNAPENSIQALQNSMDMGVDVMEIDLEMTKDSILVLMHDHTINRTMSGKGEVKSYTLDELKKMTLKSAHACPTRHRIPTFEEFMLAAKGKMFINIDKCYPYLKEVKKVLEKTGTTNQVMINTEKNYKSNITDYGQLFTQLPMKANVDLDKMSVADVNEYIEKMKPHIMEMVFATDTSRFIQHHELVTNHKIKIYINSLWASLCAGHEDDIAVEQHNTKDSWDWIIMHGANIIQTDRPKELLQYLKTRGLHQ